MEFTVQNLCGFLIRSKLMSPDGMKAMFQRWQAEAKENSASLPQFTKWLIANKYVTEYQASLLAKGHADDFFLNQYMILERLGRGHMAGVYKAAHPLGQVVAIKVLPPSKAKNPLTFGRFQREAQLSVKLKHPNVVRSFQVGKAGAVHYLVMEYLEGETLDDVLQRRKRLPPAEAVRIIHQALMGLQHIHEHGMVHRDLKPANLMLVPAAPPADGDTTLKATVKILDIGLARQLFEEGQPPPETNPELTAEGVLLGTPDYLAPEQARDPRTVDIRADIYSLGCVLYHALAGRPPFLDRNILGQMVRHATETAKPLRDFNPQIPDGLQQILDWMIAKKPEERYPTPERAAKALQMFLLADDAPARPIDEGPQMRSYLTWLESNQQDEAETVNIPASAVAPAKPAPQAAPAQVPGKPAASPGGNPGAAAPASSVSPPSGGAPAAIPDKVRSRQTPHPPHRRDKKKHKRRKDGTRRDAPVAAPASPPAAAAAPLNAAAATPQFDVELVAAEAPPPAPLWKWSKREWIVAGIGAAAMLALVVVIWIMFYLFGS
ncbi:MAG: serine/threonine protein kinase [Gemmataceae bacterium]|nr:serine/threonine protein kinase [Gemmataceae bacterium]